MLSGTSSGTDGFEAAILGAVMAAVSLPGGGGAKMVRLMDEGQRKAGHPATDPCRRIGG